MVNKTVSSLSVYESAYVYCPNQAIMISTRHNIINFNSNFLSKLSASISEKFHYYYVNTINEKNETTFI